MIGAKMGKGVASLVGSTFTYGIASVLQKGLIFLLLPIYTRYFAPAEYGVIALVTLLMTGITGFFNLGTGNSMGILFFQSQPEDRGSLVWSTFLLLIINSSILCGLTFFFSQTISLALFDKEGLGNFIKIAVVTLFFTTVTDPFYSYLRMVRKEKTYVFLTTIDCVLSILLSILMIVFLKMGIKGFFIAALVSKILSALVIYIVVGTKLKFSFRASYFKPLVRIGLPSIFGVFAFMLIDLIDRKFISYFLGDQAVGIYSLGYNLGMVMLIVVNAFNTSWAPFFMSFVNRVSETREIFGKVLKYYLIVFCFLSIFFFGFARVIIEIIATQQYAPAYLLIGIIAASYIFKGCYVIFLPGIYFSYKTYVQSIVEWVAAIINICLNFVLIQHFGMMGAAIATFVSYLALPVITYLVGRKILMVHYQWGKIFMILGMAFSVWLLIFFSYSILSAAWQMIASILLATVYITICYLYMLSDDERGALQKKVSFRQGLI